MVGIYGNSIHDLYMERQLNEYLDKQESEQVSDDIEISQDEAAIFLKVVGNMPSSFDKIVDDATASLFDTEKDYANIMKLWDRLHALVQEEDL